MWVNKRYNKRKSLNFRIKKSKEFDKNKNNKNVDLWLHKICGAIRGRHS